jgi:hypothetical protein
MRSRRLPARGPASGSLIAHILIGEVKTPARRNDHRPREHDAKAWTLRASLNDARAARHTFPR